VSSRLAPGVLGLIGDTPLVELPRLSPKRSVQIYAKLEGATVILLPAMAGGV